MAKKRKKPTVEERAAYHEAGHVIMAYLLRRRFRFATIDQNELDKETKGLVRLAKLNRPWEDICLLDTNESRAKIEREIKVTLGGEVAEALLVGRRNWLGAKDDIKNCINFCTSQSGSFEEAEAYLRWLWLGVQNNLKLREHWAYVQAVAKALLEHRRISYHKARTIIVEVKSNCRKKLFENRDKNS